jgi:tetratricopeptide (TPR) repeat protein
LQSAGFLDPGPLPPYYDRGLAYEKKGEHDKAIADFRTALAFDPVFQPARDALLRLGAPP